MAQPDMTFALVERTPYTLRYLATCEGGRQGDYNSGIIPNDGLGGTPDLMIDGEIAGSPIYFLVNQPTIAQADARELFNGDTLTVGGIDGNLQNRHRGRLTVMPRNYTNSTMEQWSVDADVNIGGRPVITVIGPNTASAEAYIELHVRHSDQR